MLSCACFGDDFVFAHSFGEQGLTDGVIDFVCAGVVEVFAFEVDFCTAAIVGESFSEVKGVGASDEGAEEFVEFLLERGVCFGFVVFGSEFFQGVHQGFGDETTSEFTEPAGWVRDIGGCFL